MRPDFRLRITLFDKYIDEAFSPRDGLFIPVDRSEVERSEGSGHANMVNEERFAAPSTGFPAKKSSRACRVVVPIRCHP